MKTNIIFYCILLFLISHQAKAQQWEFVGLDSMIINQIYILSDTIWASTAHRVGNLDKSGLYKSTDRGNYWIRLDDSLGNGHVSLFLIDRYNTNNVWIIKGYSAYGIEGVLYRTTDGGENWNYAQNITQNVIQWFGISPFNNNEMYFIDQTYAPGGFLNSLFKSSNGGYSWQGIGNFPSSSHGRSIVFNFSITDSNKLYAAINDRIGGEYLYISNNKGSSWNYISEPPATERELITEPAIPDRIFIFPGYYLTEDGGYTWTVADSGLPDVNSYLSFYFDTTDKTIFYNLRKDGLYKTRNNPINWQLIKGSDSLPLNLGGQGFQYYDIGMLKNVFIDTLYNVIYVGTASGIYKKDLITEVKEKTNNITSEFILNQNYPNPFNPTTTISYQIPEKSFVNMKIYDVLGNEINIIVSEEKLPGEYQVEFSGTDLTSGVYFYVLTAEAKNNALFRKGKKMLLIK